MAAFIPPLLNEAMLCSRRGSAGSRSRSRYSIWWSNAHASRRYWKRMVLSPRKTRCVLAGKHSWRLAANEWKHCAFCEADMCTEGCRRPGPAEVNKTGTTDVVVANQDLAGRAVLCGCRSWLPVAVALGSSGGAASGGCWWLSS